MSFNRAACPGRDRSIVGVDVGNQILNQDRFHWRRAVLGIHPPPLVESLRDDDDGGRHHATANSRIGACDVTAGDGPLRIDE